MIALLKGIVSARELDRVIIEVHGVGYEVAIPARDAAFIQEGENVVLFVAENIRDDAYELYGFRTTIERSLYLKLVSVNGVGPRMAHAILSVYDVETLSTCINEEDVMKLSRVPGVGKKTAQRIILELNGKLVQTGSLKEATQDDQAQQALVQLGYTREQAARALQGVDAEADTSERVRQALKGLSQ